MGLKEMKCEKALSEKFSQIGLSEEQISAICALQEKGEIIIRLSDSDEKAQSEEE